MKKMREEVSWRALAGPYPRAGGGDVGEQPCAVALDVGRTAARGPHAHWAPPCWAAAVGPLGPSSH